MLNHIFSVMPGWTLIMLFLLTNPLESFVSAEEMKTSTENATASASFEATQTDVEETFVDMFSNSSVEEQVIEKEINSSVAIIDSFDRTAVIEEYIRSIEAQMKENENPGKSIDLPMHSKDPRFFYTGSDWTLNLLPSLIILKVAFIAGEFMTTETYPYIML